MERAQGTRVVRDLLTHACVQVAKLKKKDHERLIQEMELLKSITHPNITAIYDSWKRDRDRIKYVVFITELMTSGTLKQ